MAARDGAVFGPQKGKLIVCKVTQSSTAAPAVTAAVVNTSNLADPIATRTSAGLYPITVLSALFTAGKTFCKITPSKNAAVLCTVTYTSTTVITLQFYDAATPSAADSGDFDMEILIYD